MPLILRDEQRLLREKAASLRKAREALEARVVRATLHNADTITRAQLAMRFGKSLASIEDILGRHRIRHRQGAWVQCLPDPALRR